ncbi:MAG: hypothetical protein CM15mV25_0810 [uncultured marine virus]|nr:MAG: hypothetical protein CM15mV25_0810 [uncultured marine virus]
MQDTETNLYMTQQVEIRDDRNYMSMLEDFWLQVERCRGTDISTLRCQNLGEITDLEYFRSKLYRSLNVHQVDLSF